jgi:asparagine synthase (glutamine-hydrolysing)
LEDLCCADEGRRLYVFLLLNDQRRHLANHFEELDSHRLELQLPFFDSDFLQVMSAVPLDLCLYHAFYAKWLGYFIPAVTAVPWQSYPGHVPCPLPIPRGLQYQWNPKGMGDIREARRRELLAGARDMLHAARFPSDLLRKSVVQLASWIYQANLRDYGYVLRHAAMYYKYWRRSSGRWTRPPGAWLNEIG